MKTQDRLRKFTLTNWLTDTYSRTLPLFKMGTVKVAEQKRQQVPRGGKPQTSYGRADVKPTTVWTILDEREAVAVERVFAALGISSQLEQALNGKVRLVLTYKEACKLLGKQTPRSSIAKKCK